VKTIAVGRAPLREGRVAPSPLDYQQALAWLYGLQRFGIKLGLENIQRLISNVAPAFCRSDANRTGTLPSPRVIHVAGTNGKGSVCAMIEAIARAAGHRTGLFISPHLVTFRERIRVSGEMISESDVADGLAKIREIIRDWDSHPTFFEVTTALALDYFSRSNLDLVILETGLGGRLDATNAVPSTVSVVTPISFDHEKWLGQTIPEIAGEKAGIIKLRTPVISAPQLPEAERIIRLAAAKWKAPLEIVDEWHDQTAMALQGRHQKQNAAVAIRALRASDMKIDDAAVTRGLSSVDWPARFQRWDERTIIDGAHNPAAARVLAETWKEIFGDKPATLILAVLSDKDIRGIWEALKPISSRVLLPRIRSERAADPEKLAQTISGLAPAIPRSIAASVAAAFELAQAGPDPILVTGSLHFAGEVLAHLRGEPAAFEECAQ
jgi:dihydrofolate synthase / folylpolyglutamate synthase